jgi:hypothetical protein
VWSGGPGRSGRLGDAEDGAVILVVVRYLLLVAIVAISLVGCGPMAAPSTQLIDSVRATQIAKDLVVAGQPSGTGFVSLEGQGLGPSGTKHRVKIDAEIVPPGSQNQHALIHFLIDVDMATGIATVVGQG